MQIGVVQEIQVGRVLYYASTALPAYLSKVPEYEFNLQNPSCMNSGGFLWKKPHIFGSEGGGFSQETSRPPSPPQYRVIYVTVIFYTVCPANVKLMFTQF